MNHATRIIIAITLILTGLGKWASPAEPSGPVLTGQPVPGGQIVDFHLPEAADGSVPLIVLLHGGGNRGNGDMTAFAQALAHRGSVVAVPTYFSGQPRTKRDVENTFRDVVCSIRYARSRAAEFGANPENLILVGFSYGGYPAMAIRLAGDDAYQFDCLPEISYEPQAVVGLGGAYKYDSRVGVLGWDEDASRYLIDGSSRSSTIPVVLVHGANDFNVPAEFAERYFAELDAAGHRVALQIIDTRHAELIDPLDPAGVQAIESIVAATSGTSAVGRSGPPTTSPYARLMGSDSAAGRLPASEDEPRTEGA